MSSVINPMQSRNEFLQKVKSLKQWQFVAYIDKCGNNMHIVRLRCLEWAEKGLSQTVVVQDYLVHEYNGKLSAATLDYSIQIPELR